MTDSIRTISLPSNEEMAHAYFPHLVRSLPQYREDLFRPRLTWTMVSNYISTFYVALECASSMENLVTLQQELEQFTSSLPAHACYQPESANPFDGAVQALQLQGTILTGAPLHSDNVLKLLSVLTATLFLVSGQDQLNIVRRTVEPISARLVGRSVWRRRPSNQS